LTTIEFDVPYDSFVNISIHDVLGRKIAQLVFSDYLAGSYKATWNADNYSSGLYMVRMTAGDYTGNQKILLVK